MSFIFCIFGAAELVVAVATHPSFTSENYFAGFRTTFTLTNPEAWKKVNTFASICIAIAAAIMIAVNMIFVNFWVAIGSVLLIPVAVAITFIYHETLRRKLKK